MSVTQPVGIEYDFNSKNFSKNQLPLFSPFDIVQVKSVTRMKRDGKPYNTYEAIITPVQNKAVKVTIDLSKPELDKIRAVRTLNPTAAIVATLGANDSRGYATIIYSGANTPR